MIMTVTMIRNINGCNPNTINTASIIIYYMDPFIDYFNITLVANNLRYDACGVDPIGITLKNV